MDTTTLPYPQRACAGSEADRLWHLAHGQPCERRICWPTADGLPDMSLCRYPDDTAGRDWLLTEVAAQFGDDAPADLVAQR